MSVLRIRKFKYKYMHLDEYQADRKIYPSEPFLMPETFF